MQVTHFVDIDNARLDAQRQVMHTIIDKGHCPFCPENLQLYHKQPILRETPHWILTPNQWPYEHTRVHLLAIHKAHIEMLSQISPQAAQELFELFTWAEKKYQAPGGGIAMRFGDSNYSAGTVRHIHGLFIVPSIDDADFQPVRFKIGKTPKKE